MPVRAPALAILAVRPSTRRQGSPRRFDPDRDAAWMDPSHRLSEPPPPTVRRRFGCTRHDAHAGYGYRSTSDAQPSPADRITPTASRKPIMILQTGATGSVRDRER